MAMRMKPLLNILMNSSPMILISRLGCFCACFGALKRSQLRSHKFYFNLNPKMDSSNKSCKEVLVVWMHWNLQKKIVGVKPLPRKLLLQMDNCVKDNKNHHLLAFLSLLTTQEVFKEVQLGFLVVGHTHENIDGSFGYLSKTLKEQNNYVMVDLMKSFMFSQDCPFILQLIQEIFYFKSWVNGYLNDGPYILVGHT